MGLAETAQMAVRIGLDDKLSPGLKKASGNLGKFESSTKKASGNLSHFESSTRRVGAGIGRLAGNLSQFQSSTRRIGGGITELAGGLARVGVVAGGAVATGLGVAIKWAGDFQAQLNTINTIAQTTPTELTKIGDGIRGIARQTGVATDELTAAYYDLLSAGIKTADAQAVLNDSVTLGIGGLATTTETVDLLTTAYNAYGLNAKGAAVATDQFAQAIQDGKVKASEIASTFANVAAIAHTAGIGIDQIAASYGFLTAQGVPAAEVTTEMNRSIVELLKPGKALADLQTKLGKNYADLARKKGLVPALEQLRIDAKKAGVPLADLFGRLEAYKFAVQTTGPKFAAFMAEQARILNSNGAALKQAQERQQGFNYSISVLTANIKDAGITIGSYLLPPLARLAQKAAAFLRRDDIQAKLKELGAGLAKAIDGIDFDKLVSAASGFAAAIEPALKTLLKIGELISKLPPGVLGAGAGLVIANKVSGGAIGGGIGQILGGLGETLAKSLAAKIPLFGAAFVQPVFVTNPGFQIPGVPGGPSEGGSGDAGGGSAKGGTAGAGIFIADMHAFNQDLANRLSTGQNADSPFAKTAAAAFGAQAAKETPWDKFLEGIGLKQASDKLDSAASALGVTARDMDKNLAVNGPTSRDQGSHDTLKTPKQVFKALKKDGIDLGAIAQHRRDSLKIPNPVPSIHQLRDRLAAVLHQEARAQRAGDSRTASRLAHKSDELRSRIAHLTAVAAAKLAANKAEEARTTAAARATERVIKAKKLAVTVHTTVNASTAVSITAIQRAAKVSSRVARTTRFAYS